MYFWLPVCDIIDKGQVPEYMGTTAASPQAGTLSYPQLKTLFDAEWTALTEQFGSAKFDAVAAELAARFKNQKLPSRLRSYRYGRRRPRPAEIDEVAGWFFRNDIAQKVRFAQRLRAAAYPDGDHPVGVPYFTKDDLRQNKRDLKIGAVAYQPFCNPTSIPFAPGMLHGFIDALFERFLRFSSLKSSDQQYQQVDLAEAIPKLATADLDVVLGILATADRTLELLFFAMLPLRIGLNAVILRSDDPDKHEENVKSVQKAMTQRSAAGTIDNVFPVILPMEIGGLYVERGLLWKGGEPIKVKTLDPEAFRQALIDPAPGKREVRVVVADEISCLKLQRHLKINGTACDLVFQLSGMRDADHPRLPQYMLGCATHVGADKLSEHLTTAMNLYVDADDDVLVGEYVELFGTLVGEVIDPGNAQNEDESVRNKAIHWALHQLRLGDGDFFPNTCIFPDSLRVQARARMRKLEPRPRWLDRHHWIVSERAWKDEFGEPAAEPKS